MPCSDYYTNISWEQQLASVMDWCNAVWELQLAQVIYDALVLMYGQWISEKSCWDDAFPSSSAAPQWTTWGHCRRMLHLSTSLLYKLMGWFTPLTRQVDGDGPDEFWCPTGPSWPRRGGKTWHMLAMITLSITLSWAQGSTHGQAAIYPHRWWKTVRLLTELKTSLSLQKRQS